MATWTKQLNVMKECRTLRLGIWRCPPFLVLFLGVFTIISMLSAYLLASRYVEDPEVAALIVVFITVLFLIIGNLIISSFNRIVEASNLKSEFISVMSHELRSPLSIFKWTLDLMEREMKKSSHPEPDSPAYNLFQTLRETSQKMVNIVNSLLEVGHIDSKDYVLKGDALSLVAMTGKIIEELKKYAATSNLSISFSPAPDLPQAYGDYDRVLMVMRNLLDNAIRYSNRGGAISIGLEKLKHQIRWSIADQGVGIPSSQQKYIFEKAFRANNILKYQTRGSGLGLFMSRAVIAGLGGKIGFKSQEGVGSTFWFTLPVAR